MRGFISFEPADYFLDEEPLEGSVWDGWIKGENPAIDAVFAQVNYWWLNDALGSFVEGETRAFPEKYKKLFGAGKGASARALFAQEFSFFMQEILDLLGNEHPLQPFRFETLATASSVLSADETRTMAAYSIWCMDKGMTGLLNGSAADAASGFTYSQIALEIAHESRRFASDETDTRNLASIMGRKGAREKLKRDPKQKEKTFIFECWKKWQQSPSNYPSKAAFARDMLTKSDNLTSQKKIEDWCREWEKAHPAG